MEEIEWRRKRRKWLRWTKMFSKTKRFIEIEFSKEMGSRKGTWKGGTIGCGFDLTCCQMNTQEIVYDEWKRNVNSGKRNQKKFSDSNKK